MTVDTTTNCPCGDNTNTKSKKSSESSKSLNVIPFPQKSALKKQGVTGQRNIRPKRRLRFTAYDEVLEIPHINDLSAEEVEAVWMHPDEFTRIRRECLGAVGDIGEDKVSDGFLLRGLDQHTNRYKQTRDFIGRQVYDAVLSVQEFERANGLDCSELMAKLSQKYSEPSVIAAQSAALSDLFSSFKGTWSHRSIPTIPDGPLRSGTWEAQC